MWKELARALKHKYLMTIQRALDNTARRLRIRAPISATAGMLKLTLSLGFRLDHRDNLCTGLHQFGIVQYNSTIWKVLKARAN